MQKEEKKVSFKRFVYSLIEYVAYISPNDLTFDVSSYVYNEDCRKSAFARSKISRCIKRHCKEKIFDNRFFLTMSFNDNSDRNTAIELLKNFSIEFKNGFANSQCFLTLKNMGLGECTKTIIEEDNFFAIVFDVSNNSTIECIISTDTITSKLIQRDNENDVIEYNYSLHQNLQSFHKHIKR